MYSEPCSQTGTGRQSSSGYLSDWVILDKKRCFFQFAAARLGVAWELIIIRAKSIVTPNSVDIPAQKAEENPTTSTSTDLSTNMPTN
jgi:hypothetical protein